MFNMVRAKVLLENYDKIVESKATANIEIEGIIFYADFGLCSNICINDEHYLFLDAITEWRKSEGLDCENFSKSYWIGGRYEYNSTEIPLVNPLRKSALKFLIEFVKQHEIECYD